jgi:hypothetical protein
MDNEAKTSIIKTAVVILNDDGSVRKVVKDYNYRYRAAAEIVEDINKFHGIGVEKFETMIYESAEEDAIKNFLRLIHEEHVIENIK